MPERALQQNRAGRKHKRARQRGGKPLSEQPTQQRRKAALQSKADKGKPAEILERPAQRCRQRTAQHSQQRDRIGVRNADALRRVDGLRYAERPAQRTASVEQPARVVLLDVLFNVAAAAEGVVGDIQGGKAVHQQKYGSAEQRPQPEQPGAAGRFMVQHTMPHRVQ